MTRRWSLITTIAVLAVALAFVVTQIVRGEASGGSGSGKQTEPTESASPSPSSSSSPSDSADPLRGLGWWPLHHSGTAKAGEHDAVVNGGGKWTDGPEGGALRLNGDSSYVDTHTRIDTTGADYSVAVRVKLAPGDMKGFHTAVSQDGKKVSNFFLQYSAPDENFAFSFPGARTVAEKTGKPEPGHWYHLTGTYSHKDHRARIYVDGRLANSRQVSHEAEPAGDVVIGRAKSGGKPVDHWSGAIADVHVYDRELTAGEVKSLSAHEPD